MDPRAAHVRIAASCAPILGTTTAPSAIAATASTATSFANTSFANTDGWDPSAAHVGIAASCAPILGTTTIATASAATASTGVASTGVASTGVASTGVASTVTAGAIAGNVPLWEIERAHVGAAGRDCFLAKRALEATGRNRLGRGLTGPSDLELIGGTADRECAAMMRKVTRATLCRLPGYAA